MTTHVHRRGEQTSTYIPFQGVVPGNGYLLVETDGIRPLADGTLLVAVRLDFGDSIGVRLLRVTPAGGIDATYLAMKRPAPNGLVTVAGPLGNQYRR